MKPILVLGGGGHAKVVIDTLHSVGATVAGFLDKNPSLVELLGVPQLGDADPGSFHQYAADEILLANGFGAVGKNRLRSKQFESWKSHGFTFTTILHPAAYVSPAASLEEGAQVMAGAIVQAGSRIGPNAIINTRAAVDHDCLLEAHTHVATGAVLSGGVHLRPGAFIGAGASIIQGIRIGQNSVVGAGSVVVRDVPDNCRVMGAPAHHKCSPLNA